MILLIDIGNTYTKFKFDNKDVIRIETSKITDSNYLINYFKDDNSSLFRCSISSVVIGKADIIKEFIEKKYNITPLIISKYLKTNCIYPKHDKNELGSDLISLIEGSIVNDDTFVSISLGTATVINFVMNKKFMGCSIIPGILTSFNGLINSASLIEDTILDGDFNLLGLTTKDSLKSGVFNELIFTIERYVHEIEKTYNIQNLKVYITGGFINVIKNKLNLNAIYDDELIFKGMKNIMDINYE